MAAARGRGDSKTYDHVLKFILLGDRETGKTAFYNQYLFNNFQSSHVPTKEPNGESKFVLIENRRIKLEVFDLPYQASLPNHEFSPRDGMMFVFVDSTRQETLEYAQSIIDEADDIKTTIALIHAKNDLVSEEKISVADCQKFAEQNDVLFFSTSAKTGAGVIEAVNKTIKIILSQFEFKNQPNLIEEKKQDSESEKNAKAKKKRELELSIDEKIETFQNKKEKLAKKQFLENLADKFHQLNIHDGTAVTLFIVEHIEPALDKTSKTYQTLNHFDSTFGHMGSWLKQSGNKGRETMTETILLLESISGFLETCTHYKIARKSAVR